MRHGSAIWTSATALVALALWACGGATEPASQCTPGASSACVCSDGASGAQSCNSQGSGFDACVCEGGSPSDATGGEGDTDQAASDTSGPALPPTGEFSAIEPGGDTLCARGGPFRFFVYGGDPERVVIDFQGGGACWNSWTCAVGQQLEGEPFFQDSAGDLGDLEAAVESGMLSGIYDLDNPDNPFQGWTLVRVPYCTGDYYWGDVTVDYADDLTVHHRGYANAKSVTDWVTAHYPNADQVVATGCDGGAYGALNQALALAEFYPEALVTALGDSGAGIITEAFFADAFPTWNAFASMPLHLEGLAGLDLEDIGMTDFVVAAAAAYPTMRVAQYTTAHDQLQSLHYMFMGGDAVWHDLALESLTHIRAHAENFRYYVAPGPIRCINPYDITYTREVNGVAYLDWVEQLIGGAEMPNHVMCEDDCRDDPICAGCNDGSIESMACTWCDGWEP